tara:strand:- start:1037 stop:1522 length:486 start_codon:yes stop_codon:yes gene_type:complete
MRHLVNKNWTTGLNKPIDFYKILSIIKNHTTQGAKIFIGSDSFISKKRVCFATSVCLYGSELGGRYFFFKENEPEKNYTALISRITEETRRSLEVACFFMEEYKIEPCLIELHLDVSPFSAGNATSKFSDMLKGYVQGYGLDYRLKPDAWASQSIADKHSK